MIDHAQRLAEGTKRYGPLHNANEEDAYTWVCDECGEMSGKEMKKCRKCGSSKVSKVKD